MTAEPTIHALYHTAGSLNTGPRFVSIPRAPVSVLKVATNVWCWT